MFRKERVSIIVTLIISSIIFFAATNIDDIFLLMSWFSQAKTIEEKRYVVFGQYVGFIFILFFSLIGSFGALIISEAWIGLLGLFPVYLGMKQLIELYQERKLRLRSVDGDIGCDDELDDTEEDVSTNRFSWLKKVMNPNILKLATITFANGGDNIGVYVPYFSSKSIGEIILIVVLFLCLVAIWCYFGSLLVRHPIIAKGIERYGHIVVPFVLIALGIFILVENGTFHLIK
ncbi:cadmium resistance transporter [Gottfriedia acidiceleris]|uniref:cadmium resistance transporter n=1 Tax=Gottfriedia acidiceleris TaxID=371036 RepID=UPI003D234B12